MQLREDLRSGSLAAGDLTSKALEDRLYTAVSALQPTAAMQLLNADVIHYATCPDTRSHTFGDLARAGFRVL